MPTSAGNGSLYEATIRLNRHPAITIRTNQCLKLDYLIDKADCKGILLSHKKVLLAQQAQAQNEGKASFPRRDHKVCLVSYDQSRRSTIKAEEASGTI